MTFNKNSWDKIVLAALLIPFAYLGIAVVRAKAPARVKLCHLNNGSTNFLLVWPKGSHFNFVVGSPDSRGDFFAALNVTAETENGVRFLSSSTNVPIQANWLQHEGLNGYIISSGTRAEPTPKAGSAVKISLDADGVVGTNLSLWLTYLRPVLGSK